MRRNKKIGFLTVGILGALFLHLCLGSTTLIEQPGEETVGQQPPASKAIASEDSGSQENPLVDTSNTAAESDQRPRGSFNSAPRQAEITKKITNKYLYRTMLTPNDPSYSSNWPLQKMHAPAAWNISTGSPAAIIAVIDSGFALAHEDLAESWYLNPGENGTTASGDICWTGSPAAKASNHCDDDGNGYVDDYRGWNFYDVTNLPQTGLTNPAGTGVSHGTSVAGIAGAAGNNSKGNVSLNWNAKIMPLQALSDNGIGYTPEVVSAIYYAVDNGASVINLSLGGDTVDQSLKDAIVYAHDHNVVVVAAAGNCGTGSESNCEGVPAGSMSYPATEQYVISVGATNQQDQKASFSSYGPMLDVVAPGSGSLIAPRWTPGNQTSGYSAALSGTSFSAPQVSGLVSLIKSIRPSTSVEDITALVLATATKIGSLDSQLYNEQLGHGLVNANQALVVASSLNVAPQSGLTLLQAGGYQSEHSYGASEMLGSGCEVQRQTYCAIRFGREVVGFDRYLPYKFSNDTGAAGWNWNSAMLGTGLWQIRAVQGEAVSEIPYDLWRK